MRWKLFSCILLASVVMSSGNERPKRSLGLIKSLLGTKLFGAPATPTSSVVVAQLISKNATHQLFTIPGQNFNLLIQVASHNQTDDKGAIKIVSPEIAILGTYLGTKTQDETVLAIEMAKSLIKSGVLQDYKDHFLQKLVVETKEKVTPLNIYSQERDPLYIFPGVNRVEVKKPVPVYPVELPPVAVHLPSRYPVNIPPTTVPQTPKYPQNPPPLFIAPEIDVPVPTKYIYNQLGNRADMKYESYNGKEVIVTRTTKEPSIPDCLIYRIKEVAAIGGNPFVKLPVVATASPPMPVNIAPMPNYGRPILPATGSSIVDQPFKVHINTKPILFSEPVPLQKVVNISPIKHGIIETKGVVTVKSNAHSANTNINTVKLESDVDKVVIKDTNNNNGQKTSNGNIVTQYVYKQVNHQNPSLSTEVRVENQQNTNSQASQTNGDMSKNYLFVPPKDVNVPSPVGLSSQNVVTKPANNHVFTSKTVPYAPISQVTVKTSEFGSLKSNPIIVKDSFRIENRENNNVIEVNKKSNENLEATRGDIPGSIH